MPEVELPNSEEFEEIKGKKFTKLDLPSKDVPHLELDWVVLDGVWCSGKLNNLRESRFGFPSCFILYWLIMVAKR